MDAINKPSVGRIVQFVSEIPGTEVNPAKLVYRAAVVTKVDEQLNQVVSLAVFHEGNLEFVQNIGWGETVGCWRWPEIVS
jgi:hypothetical protein